MNGIEAFSDGSKTGAALALGVRWICRDRILPLPRQSSDFPHCAASGSRPNQDSSCGRIFHMKILYCDDFAASRFRTCEYSSI